MFRKTLFILFFLSIALVAVQGLYGKTPLAVGRLLLAQIGVQASAPPNQYNTLAAELQKKEAQLDQEEAALREREAALAAAKAQESRTLRYLVLVAGALLVLILGNYYLDWRRTQRNKKAVTAGNIDADHVFRIF